MANIFKTTLKKDIIADIADNGIREVRFPITKLWATRFADKYDLDEKTFEFKTFDTLEFSSPSNKDTISETCVFNYVRTIVDGDEFVLEFKDDVEEEVESSLCETMNVIDENIELDNNIPEEDNVLNTIETIVETDVEETVSLDSVTSCTDIVKPDDEIVDSINDFNSIKQWFDNQNILEAMFESNSVFATNARQVIVLPKGRVLGFKKTLPLNNDVEVRIEFDTHTKVYFDSVANFEDEIYKTLEKIRKNNFVFVWKQYTGIFKDRDGRVYFGIKYSTRKTIGFNRKYTVQ
jgi:hypothetical protein